MHLDAIATLLVEHSFGLKLQWVLQLRVFTYVTMFWNEEGVGSIVLWHLHVQTNL